MKKIIIAATLALCFTGSSFAQENAGGDAASGFALGDMQKEMIAGGATAALVILGMNANSRGTVAEDEPPVDVDPTCNGSDPLVNGVCTGTTTTLTVTGTGTLATTITVPVTFTYLPTI
jgi:hypothetical protein